MQQNIKANDLNSSYNFTENQTDSLFETYIALTLSMVTSIGCDDVVVSEHGFASALLESSKDLLMLSVRRLPNGVSKAKIAGVFAFRLSRWNIISLPQGLANSREAMQLNYLAALAFAYNFLGVDAKKIDEETRAELQYNLVRRHSNQETLGLCFELILKTQTSAVSA